MVMVPLAVPFRPNNAQALYPRLGQATHSLLESTTLTPPWDHVGTPLFEISQSSSSMKQMGTKCCMLMVYDSDSSTSANCFGDISL